MGTATAVGIDDDLASRQTCVAVGATDDELTRGVHVELHVVVEEFLQACGQLSLHPWDEDVAHVGFNLLLHELVVRQELVMLRADDDGVDAQRFPAFTVFHRHLRLGVGAEVLHVAAFVADGGQFLQKHVREVNGEGHVVLGFFASEAEHHALVASALVFVGVAFDTLEDVVRLAVKGREHTARLRVELVLRLVVADFFDHAARHVLDFDIGVGADFACHDD